MYKNKAFNFSEFDSNILYTEIHCCQLLIKLTVLEPYSQSLLSEFLPDNFLPVFSATHTMF